MLEVFKIAIALLGSLIAGIWDLKTSDIPDFVCWIMIGISILISFIEGNLFITLFAGSFLLIFGLVMYFTGQWGGGDGELLVANGMLLATFSNPYGLFLLNFFINLFFIGAVYSILYVIIYAKLFNKRIYWFSKNGIEKIFIKKINSKNLKVGDVLGEDIKSLNLSSKRIKGLTETDIKKIQKLKKYVKIKDGVRFGPVFPISIIITYYFGNLILYYLYALV
ncbi:MAG: A24 family peptidase [Candidatus Aenigmatarchaeota archaeon]